MYTDEYLGALHRDSLFTLEGKDNFHEAGEEFA